MSIQQQIAKTTAHVVPIVFPNLPRAETLNQVMDNLNYLSVIMDGAFNSIEQKISFEKSKIDTISKRVSRAQVQTELTSKKRSNQATVIYSPAMFPESSDYNGVTRTDGAGNVIIGNNYNCSPKTVFETPLINRTGDVQRIARPKYHLSKDERSKHPENVETVSLLARLKSNTDIANNINCNNSCYDESCGDMSDGAPEGLGHPPADAEHISDCLVFNTNVNPYLKESRDNRDGEERLRGLKRKRGRRGGRKKRDRKEWLGDAPPSLKNKHLKLKGLKGDEYDIGYKYQKFDNGPNYAVISQLPGLDGLALDVQFDGLEEIPEFDNITFNQLPDLVKHHKHGGDHGDDDDDRKEVQVTEKKQKHDRDSDSTSGVERMEVDVNSTIEMKNEQDGKLKKHKQDKWVKMKKSDSGDNKAKEVEQNDKQYPKKDDENNDGAREQVNDHLQLVGEMEEEKKIVENEFETVKHSNDSTVDKNSKDVKKDDNDAGAGQRDLFLKEITNGFKLKPTSIDIKEEEGKGKGKERENVKDKNDDGDEDVEEEEEDELGRVIQDKMKEWRPFVNGANDNESNDDSDDDDTEWLE